MAKDGRRFDDEYKKRAEHDKILGDLVKGRVVLTLFASTETIARGGVVTKDVVRCMKRKSERMQSFPSLDPSGPWGSERQSERGGKDETSGYPPPSKGVKIVCISVCVRGEVEFSVYADVLRQTIVLDPNSCWMWRDRGGGGGVAVG